MVDQPTITFAAIGLDHRHIYHQVGRLLELGCRCKGYWTGGASVSLEGFRRRFPDLQAVAERKTLLEDESVQLIVTAGIPNERASIAIESLRLGKDVMGDKPGVTSLDQLEAIKRAVAETGRIWSINFSERFEVKAVGMAARLIDRGDIGRVVQIAGFGPHRLNKPTRPDWFFDPARYGGILCDIASHQVDQFLFLTGSTDAQIVASTVANYANPETPGLEDFGEMMIRSDRGHGYIRVDWYTPDGLSNWGDGRLTILGTEGYLELRKYVDIAGRKGTDHLFLVDGEGEHYVDTSDVELLYYPALVNDVLERTQTAMAQSHTFKVTELALLAQSRATRLGHLTP
ncbi:MAG: Gfo/Idh/MocA family protein [Geminicoccaceae bacterium]